MLRSPFERVRVLTGPTASGKSRIALDVVKRLNAEIISMDSMAVYRGMDIGTAKPTAEEQAVVPHHLIDELDPWESASVAWWLERAEAVVGDIHSRGKTPLFVGGTPLYLKALIFGLFDGPAGDPVVRDRLTREAETTGFEELHRRLRTVDPKAAERIHANDVRRVIRALEVFELTGRPISDWQSEWSAPTPEPSGEPAVFWIDWPRPELYDRIERRVDAMFAEGLLDEVRRLTLLPRPMSREAGQALGYRECLDHLAGRVDLPTAIATVKTRTRQFAKRQVTWFRHLPGCVPISPKNAESLWRSADIASKIEQPQPDRTETDSWPNPR